MASAEKRQRQWTIVLFYRYAVVPDTAALAEWARALAAEHNLCGRLLIASEGINGTFAGDAEGIRAFTERLPVEWPNLAGTEWKFSECTSSARPFPDTSVREVPELIATGGLFRSVDLAMGGTHLEPAEWNEMLQSAVGSGDGGGDGDVAVLDVRNEKEVMVGRFRGATDPQTRFFNEFPAWVDAHADELRSKKAIMMYCTGGIRCEKASAYLRLRTGHQAVYQLHGGVHRYLEQYPDGGLFEGRNFVFDRRVMQSPQRGTPVVSTCYACSSPFDHLSGARVCTVCRDVVCACDACFRRLNGELHCRRHARIADCYFTFLDVFSADELREQRRKLLEYGAELTGRPNRQKRATVRKQVARIDERLHQLDAGEALPLSRDLAGIRCRTCRKTGCDGNCWGFWAARDEAADVEVN